jgi:hypothetical protein
METDLTGCDGVYATADCAWMTQVWRASRFSKRFVRRRARVHTTLVVYVRRIKRELRAFFAFCAAAADATADKTIRDVLCYNIKLTRRFVVRVCLCMFSVEIRT